MTTILCWAIVPFLAATVSAEWKVLPPRNERHALPARVPADARQIRPGDKWPQDNQFRWLVGDLTVPEEIDGRPARGRTVGMQINCGDGGEVHVGGELRARYDNDHPALVMIAEEAVPGAAVRVAVLVYGRVQGGDKFDEAKWVLIPPERARGQVRLEIDPTRTAGNVPDGIAGLSQGAGLADYEDATAAKLREGGFKWFRMDNVFTQVVKDENGRRVYDWTDFDRRVDFIIDKMGADPIFAVSYMPQPFDAIPNKDRQSAPRDYALWEDLCYRAAKRSLDRGKRIPFWEVWNEANTGWIKPGPDDTGTDEFKKMYNEALGREQPDQGVIRTFEAYCKLYRATARGVLRADPKAKIGGPALASGPFETDRYPYSRNGKGFARGLMLWCRQESLPLDFVSWHEYFHPADVFVTQAEGFRQYLSDFPEFQRSVKSFMVTEWSTAWWHDRPQDHEVGSAYCADCVTRAFIPADIDRPCFFYVKQNDMRFRGDWSLLMQNNLPKPTYNVLKVFNGLTGKWIRVTGADDDVSAVATWDAKQGRLAIVLVNFRYRYAFRRHVQVTIDALPPALAGGRWQEWVVDATHSNVWHDRNGAELTRTRQGSIGSGFSFAKTLTPNSVTLLELLAKD